MIMILSSESSACSVEGGGGRSSKAAEGLHTWHTVLNRDENLLKRVLKSLVNRHVV